MNAYELADELQKLDARLHLINLFKSADMLRQQADRIAELEKQSQESALDYISVCSQADEHYDRVKELAQKLSAYIVELELQKAMVQDLEKQLAFMEGEYPEPTIVQKMQEFANLEQALRKIAKYEEVLQAIANDYHELSEHKIEVQVRNHKKWAREALE